MSATDDMSEQQRWAQEYAIDPYSRRWLNTPIWCVYGYPHTPTLMCCLLRDHGSQYGVCLWGYSEWGGKPAFRTIGQRLSHWHNAIIANSHICRFFATQEAACKFLTELTTPRCGADSD